jgi:hypothetical protein
VKRYEIFCPVDGRPIFRTRFAWLARLISKVFHGDISGGLDWAPGGEGW